MKWSLRRNKIVEKPDNVVTRWRFSRLNFKRLYKAASQDRLTADWLSAGGDLNQELKSQLSIVRARARELEQNSNICRRYLSLVEIHVVGPDGFTLLALGRDGRGELDVDNNKAIMAEFKRWARRGVCELTGRHSFREATRISARTAARDGECLIRMHDVKPNTSNPWGLVIELLDPARLDHTLNENLKNGHRIRLGIELNAAGRPVAYWLRQGERAGYVIQRDTHERVPAEDIIHWFESDRPEQLRAVSWMVSGMLTVHQLDAYQEAAITNARAGASKMGWILSDDNTHALADSQDDNGDLIEELEPGVIGHLKATDNFIGFDPKYPHEMYDAFVKTNHRDLAMGWGVSYHALTGDLTDVNFSSIRSGTLEEREQWKVRQDNAATAIHERIYQRWLSSATYAGRFKTVSQETFIQTFSEHRWHGRRWAWVDPLKDIQAIVEAINAGLTSPQKVASELGVDLDEIIDQLAEYQAKVKNKQVTFPVIAKAATPNNTPEAASNADAKD